MIKAYNGDKPYVFVSYSHKDWETVSVFIKGMQENLCHVWFDEGIRSGSVWNDDLAQHLLNADAILLFLSASSVSSEFVRSEISFGRNHNINIIPVYIEDISLPIGWELQLGTIQATKIYGLDEYSALKKIMTALPDSVFLHTATPFFIDNDYSFYLKTKETLVKGGMIDKNICGLQITRQKNDKSEGEQLLFEHFPTPAYGEDAQYTVTVCNKICDKYFNERENGIIVFNVKARFLLAYPLSGPDFCALLTFIITEPNGKACSVKLIDCKVSTTDHDYDPEISSDALKKELWGTGTELENILKKMV